MVMDILGPSTSEVTSSGLTITAAFTKVLTSAYTPNYGQLSCINPEFIVFLNGDDNTAANSQVALLNSAGVTQNTLEYYANTTGEAIRVKDCCADDDATYFIGDNGNLDYYIWSTSHDGLTVNWGRKLKYAGTPQGYLNIAVATNYIYFFMGNSGGSTNFLLGQLDKATGVLNWDKYINASNTYSTYSTFKIEADDNGLYMCFMNSAYGVFAVDSTGNKLWQKNLSSALASAVGFAKSEDYLYVSGKDAINPTRLTILKLSLLTGSLQAQVTVDTSAASFNTLSFSAIPHNQLAFGGGKLIAALQDFFGNSVDVVISDENFNIETNVLVHTKGSISPDPFSISADSSGNWFITGIRYDGSVNDHFISGVLEDGTTSTGWSTTSRTVSTPSYSIGNGSGTLADLTPTTNATESITVSSPADLATEAW